MNKQQSVNKDKSEPSGRQPRRHSRLWRVGRFCLLGLATLITLFVLFHIEENWRGKRAWEAYKAEMEAKGEVFELEKLAPPLVPDDQNFAMTPLLKPLLELNPPGTKDADGRERRWKDPEGKARAESILVNDPKLSERLKYGPDSGGNGDYDKLVPTIPDWRLGERIQLADWQAYYAKSEVFPSWPEARSPAEDVLKALSRYDAELAELRIASKRPYSRFNLEYDSEDPFSILLVHLQTLRNVAKVLRLKSVAELRADNVDAAYKDLNLMFVLADSIKDDPFLVDHLVRLAILQLSMQVVWEGLSDHLWTPEQLIAIQERMGNVDLLSEAKRSMKAERAAGVETIEGLVRRPGMFFRMDGSEQDKVQPSVLRLIPRGWWYLETLEYSRAYEEYILSALPEKAEDLDVALVKARYAEVEAKLGGSPIKAFFSHRMLINMLLPALEKAVSRSTEAQAMNDMGVIAIALERYRMANDSYPESLTSLAPDWLEPIPNDPVSQKPFMYDSLASGAYRLWSTGWGMTDDGGEAFYTQHSHRKVRSRNDGDWVWPAPGGLRLRETDE